MLQDLLTILSPDAIQRHDRVWLRKIEGTVRDTAIQERNASHCASTAAPLALKRDLSFRSRCDVLSVIKGLQSPVIATPAVAKVAACDAVSGVPIICEEGCAECTVTSCVRCDRAASFALDGGSCADISAGVSSRGTTSTVASLAAILIGLRYT